MRSQARDQEAPLQGLTSPDFREFLPRWTLAFVDTGSTETRALTIALDPTALRATGAEVAGEMTTVELTDAAGTPSTLQVTRERRKLTVTASAVSRASRRWRWRKSKPTTPPRGWRRREPKRCRA